MTFAPNLQVLSGPGFWIMLAGFAAVLLSKRLAGLSGRGDAGRNALLIKAAGCAAVVIGTVLIFI